MDNVYKENTAHTVRSSLEKRKVKLYTNYRKLLADTFTPVSVYLKLRDKFVNSILLESSDYHGNENSFSYICCEPIARLELNDNRLVQQFPDGTEEKTVLADKHQMVQLLGQFSQRFEATPS